MRVAFPRIWQHFPVMEGLGYHEHLHDWRGSATLVPPYLDTDPIEEKNPMWSWCGFRNTRVWRCGNRGNVASVLIEKPPRGNWRPIIDCGFDLQYAPLLEYAEGEGRVIFCQLDVTGRTQPDPAAERLCRNLIAYAANPQPMPRRQVVYAGDARGEQLLRDLGVPFTPYAPERLSGNVLLVVGPNYASLPSLQQYRRDGMNVLCIGLGSEDLDRILGEIRERTRGWKLPTRNVQTYSCHEHSLSDHPDSAYAGVSQADVHWRTKVRLTVIDDPAQRPQVLQTVAFYGKGRTVLCQVAPWMFDTDAKPYVRTSYRRTVFLASRLLANLGAVFETPLLDRFAQPAPLLDVAVGEGSWRGKVDREDVGRNQQWWAADLDDTTWEEIRVPGPPFDVQRAALKDYDGLFWYRVRFRVPEGLKTDDVTLHVGPVDDESWVWLNGEFLGEVTKKTNPDDYWRFPREYPLKRGQLNVDGENVLAVRVNDTYKTGGITGEPRLRRPAPWLDSYYVQVPIADDDPYRYYRW
jgi:hypothetical protein